MQTDPATRAIVDQVWNSAAFISDLGIRLHGLGKGWCESELTLLPRHLQQNGFVHAGVQATMADHTSGAAASTLAEPGQFVLTVEFKLSLLRAGKGEKLFCRADVLKPGRSVSFVEALLYAVTGEERTLISKMTATMAVGGTSRA